LYSKGRLAGDDLGEGGAHAKEAEKLLAEFGEFAVTGGGVGLGVDLGVGLALTWPFLETAAGD
jgi:hypothetical protein